MNSYMLLFWAPKHLLAAPRSPEQARESGQRWHAWAEELKEAGRDVTGAQLEADGRCVRGAQKAVAGGTFDNGDHLFGGYFVVSASSLDEATEIAKGCPVLASGGTVEVRPVRGAD